MPEDELKYSSLVTDVGAKKLALAANAGEKIDIKYFLLGDGNGEYYQPEPSQTELKNLCYQGEISSYSISPNDDKQLLIKCQVPSDSGHFIIREWGLMDSDGDLIAIANISDIEIVPFKTGEILNFRVSVYVQFDNSQIDGVNIVVKPTSEEILKEEILAEVNSAIRIYEADQTDIETLLDYKFDSPDLEKYEEATEEDIRSLFV